LAWLDVRLAVQAEERLGYTGVRVIKIGVLF
jgi:hypothetical protein